MVTTLLRLCLAGMLPVLLSAGLYLAEKKTCFGRWRSAIRQTIIGVLFGALAALSTEMGIDVGGASINVRDAAPLCAGLIFGAPAGLIAGVIGGVERWFASLWGIGTYTRLACSLATVLAGLFGAAIRKYLFDDKKPTWFYGLTIGMTTEVLHMLMIFLTNMSDVTRAFLFVKRCALPMLLSNGLSVMLAVLVVSLLGREKIHRPGETKKIAQTFQRWLLFCVVIAFCLTSYFTFALQTRLAEASTDDLLNINMQDVRSAIDDASNQNLLSVTRWVASAIPSGTHVDRAFLQFLANQCDVAEINLVGANGTIIASTNEQFVGFNMASGKQSAEFLPLLSGTDAIVQRYQPITFNSGEWRKYAGVALKDGSFVQVGYDADRFQQDIGEQVANAARNRHIGQNGCVIICDENWIVVSDRDGHEGENLEETGVWIDVEQTPENARFTATVYQTKSICIYTRTEGYYIIAVLPESEALFSRDIAVYITVFMEILVFAALFAHIYFLIKKLVVENIQKVNGSLAQITNGNLDVVVNVRANAEFASLSDDINTTVVTLKQYIAEAAARIDRELEFARAIQHSALPSVFPPYPNRRDFDIFASMDAAKEIGGDFYDFYLLGQHSLAFLIADVSGKGIPAAMFMMTAKTLLKSLAESGLGVAEVFTRANHKLCENNDTGMFVTAWMGMLDLQTGIVRYANAGHNPPLLKRCGEPYDFLRTKANFILAGMDGVPYREHELQLAPGDTLYLYTDGVTEATDGEDRLFGEQRLLDGLNASQSLDVQALCAHVKDEVDAFVGEAPQFDDITMVAVRLNALPGSADLA